MAGLTAAAVVAPKGMAYATIAGLPVQVGLYTCIVPMAVYAALGTSRPLSVSTTTTIAILSATAWALRRMDPRRVIPAAATLALLVGVLLLLAARFVSASSPASSQAGADRVQIRHGLVIVGSDSETVAFIVGRFFRDVLAIVEQLPSTSVVMLLVAVAMLA